MAHKMSGWDIVGLVLGGVACGLSIADAAQGVSKAKESLAMERERLRRAEYERSMARYRHDREMAQLRDDLRRQRLERLREDRMTLEETARGLRRLGLYEAAERYDKLAERCGEEIRDILLNR